MAYPVNVSVEARLAGRNRLTTAFSPILALPHAVLTGPVYFSFRTGTVGLFGAAAYFLAIISWFTLLFGPGQPSGIRDFSMFYLRWRTRALGYMTFLTDRYPPFGEGEYPVRIDVMEPETRDRLTIALRPILAIPHLIIVCVLAVLALATSVVAWFAIVFTGAMPRPLFTFNEGMLRWVMRVEAYMLLLVDDYPPVTLEAESAPAIVAPVACAVR